jgi:hypothetical protein
MSESHGRRQLPFRGELSELAIIGNGKDCTLQIRLPDGRGFGIPLSGYGSGTNVICCTSIVVSVSGAGDSALVVRYRPHPGWRMRVALAELDYPGSAEDWARDCAVWDRMSRARWPTESSWAVGGVDIELAAWQEAPAAQGQSST